MPDKLSPAGSAVYNSDSLSVGDGTWDSTTNTFLLPNLQGLPFATMQYNGMANRFSTMPGYQSLIEAHGIIAAITFLFIVPFSIAYLRFYRGSSRWALRVHIWCQIVTVMTTTALFALGFLAVGPGRSLTNPHHGIGVAIYVLVLTQFLLGWFTHSRERRKRLTHAPLKAVLHRWMGGATALLAIAQVPLGLTLYGSPVYLFVLYAVLMSAWVLLFFVLSYLDERDRGRDRNSEYSWASGSGSMVGKRHNGHMSTLVKTAAAGAGAAWLFSKFRGRKDERDHRGSQHSASYLHSEKYSGYDDSEVTASRHGGGGGGGGGGWGKKLLGLGALGGVGYGIGKMFGRRNRDEDAETGSYTHSSDMTEDRYGVGASPNARHPLTGPSTHGGLPSAGEAAAIGAGALGAGALGAGAMGGAAMPPPVPAHRRRDSYGSYSSEDDDDFSSASPSHQRRNHGIRDTIATVGALGLARKLFTGRKAKKEQRRIDELRQQDVDDERVNRMNSKRQRLTGDGYPSARRAGGPPSVTSTNLTPLPAGAPSGPPMATGAMPPGPGYPPNPAAGPAYPASMTVDGQPLPFAAPPPRDPVPLHSGSGANLGAGAAGAAAGLAAGAALGHRDGSRDSRRQSRRTDSTDATAPVSVKLNMHNDGRHVTLRRLTEEEAAADRARRGGDARQQQRRRRRGAPSGSSVSGGDDSGAGERWRRAEQAQRQAETQIGERQRLQASQAALNAQVPPPPPIPGSELPAGSVTSPGGTYDGNTTEASTNYERNRQRRRAERAANTRARASRLEYD